MTGKSNEQAEQRHGDFIWYELMTTDIEAAQSFYGGQRG